VCGISPGGAQLRLELAAGTYTLQSGFVFDSRFTVTELAFVVDANGGDVRIQLDSSAVRPLFHVTSAAPDTRYEGITLAGQIVVDDANAMNTCTSCTFVPSSAAQPIAGGALSVTQGRVLVEQCSFTGHHRWCSGSDGLCARDGDTNDVHVQCSRTRRSGTRERSAHTAYVAELLLWPKQRLRLGWCHLRGTRHRHPLRPNATPCEQRSQSLGAVILLGAQQQRRDGVRSSRTVGSPTRSSAKSKHGRAQKGRAAVLTAVLADPQIITITP